MEQNFGLAVHKEDGMHSLKGQFGMDIWLIVKYWDYSACDQYSQPYSLGGSGDVVFTVSTVPACCIQVEQSILRPRRGISSTLHSLHVVDSTCRPVESHTCSQPQAG